MIFSEGRCINSGIFAAICELCIFLNDSENVFIRDIFSSRKFIPNVENKIKEFVEVFALQIKDKFKKGISFPQENPFQKQDSTENQMSNEQMLNIAQNETYKELIERCTMDLSFVNINKPMVICYLSRNMWYLMVI